MRRKAGRPGTHHRREEHAQGDCSLPRLVGAFGPAEAAQSLRAAGRLVGAQPYEETASTLGITVPVARAVADGTLAPTCEG